jgi:PST family polysaccharide transporter
MVALVANMIGDFGLGPALIRAPEIDEGMLNCVFWSNLALSLALAGIIVASAGWIAILFKDQALVEPLRVSALIVPLTSIRAVHRALLERALAFQKVAIAETAGTVFGCIAGIVAALAGADVWALVIQQIGLAGAPTAAFFVAARWRPRALFPIRQHWGMFRFGGYLTVANMGGLLAQQASRPIISRYLGLGPLGFYTVAAQMIDYPIRNIAAVLQRIMLPVFSRAEEDDARLRHMHLTVTHAICVIVLPMIVLMTLLSDEITALLLGPGWEPVSGLLVYLALSGALRAVGVPNVTLLLVKDRAGLMFWINAVASGTTVLVQFVAVRFGLEAVAISQAAISFAMAVLVWLISFRLIGQSAARMGAALARPLASAAVMVLVVHLLAPFCGPSPLAVILICGAAGTASFAAAEAIFDRGRFGEIVSALVGQVRGRA